MKRIFFRLHTGYCGSDAHDVVDYEDDITEDELDEDAYRMAVENAARYGYELCSEDCDDDECDLEHPGSSNIEGSWEVYDPKEHDKYL